MEWIDNVLRDVAELPDRNSPEDWPEAMLVTGAELRQIIVAHAAAAMAAYARDCKATHPALSDELSVEYPPNMVDASTVDRTWARFCGAFGDGPDAPYPGMIAAFETHYGQPFRDKAWRTEAACWAAAWHKATEQASRIKPPKSGD